jgi:predicted enzyme related to lactoylglutathione lyase
MTVQSFDIGFVSATDALITFYATVLELDEIEPREFPMGVVRRLACGGGVLKVMIPAEAPEAPAVPPMFFAMSGLRYATMWVDDVGAVVERWRAHGGTVLMEPSEMRPGTTGSLVADPDGNTIEIMHEH